MFHVIITICHGPRHELYWKQSATPAAPTDSAAANSEPVWSSVYAEHPKKKHIEGNFWVLQEAIQEVASVNRTYTYSAGYYTKKGNKKKNLTK